MGKDLYEFVQNSLADKPLREEVALERQSLKEFREHKRSLGLPYPNAEIDRLNFYQLCLECANSPDPADRAYIEETGYSIDGRQGPSIPDGDEPSPDGDEPSVDR